MRLQHHTIQPPPLVKQHNHGSAKQRRALRRQDRVDGTYNTAVIQAMIDDVAVSGGIVHIPAGRYVLSSAIMSKESP